MEAKDLPDGTALHCSTCGKCAVVDKGKKLPMLAVPLIRPASFPCIRQCAGAWERWRALPAGSSI